MAKTIPKATIEPVAKRQEQASPELDGTCAASDQDGLYGSTVHFDRQAGVIVSAVGRGTTSTVYLAEDQTTSRHFALKVLSEAAFDTPTQKERFLREAEILCRVRDPGLVAGYAQGTYRGRPFLVMEYLSGGSLEGLIVKGALPVGRALDICEQVLCALDHLRRGGHLVCHRDIKPANILLDEHGHAKLADLGIAKTYLHVTRDIETGFLGTVRYMAPEQIDDAGQADIRSDLFALGAVFFEMISGTRAFPEAERSKVLAQRLAGAIPHLPSRPEFDDNPALAAACTEILERTLAPSVLDRVQTPGELIALMEKARVAAAGGPPSGSGVTAGASVPTGLSKDLPRSRRVLRKHSRPVRRIPALVVVTCELAAISVLCAGLVWGIIELLERL